MAAPTPTARGTPAGIRIDNGHRTLVTLAGNTTISFWEKTVTPPGFDGGDAVDTTTMWNDDLRTKSPRTLMEMTDFTMKAAYDPNVYNQIIALMNVETTVTITYPDGSTLAFYGFLRLFTPDELSEGIQPEASITVTPTNSDPTSGDEELPVLTSVAGT